MEDTDLCVRMHMATPATHLQQQKQQRLHQPWQQPGGGASSSSSCTSSGCVSQQQHGASSDQSASPLTALAGHAAAAAAALHAWLQPRGRVVQVLDRLSITSGRRLLEWGSLRATYIHMRLAAHWYFGGSPEQLKELYMRLYTDSFR
eukprot:GHRQ01016357.1.p1 GENE.GHRQ01016357.1~~GHRQ01016357.1.p1  ORF type:complete len:147 (+),score=64.36 GHRQ01016357.1:88-528(+)